MKVKFTLKNVESKSKETKIIDEDDIVSEIDKLKAEASNSPVAKRIGAKEINSSILYTRSISGGDKKILYAEISARVSDDPDDEEILLYSIIIDRD